MLLTRAEATGFRETSLHADVMAFLAALAGARRPAAARHLVRREPGGPRAAAARAVARTACARPAEARAPRPARSCSCINGIHAGEVEGKEASLMLVRDLLDGTHADAARRS